MGNWYDKLRVSVYMTCRNNIGKLEQVLLDHWDTLKEAVETIRANWHEGEGPQSYLFVEQDTGEFLATMSTGMNLPFEDDLGSLCITTYCDGRVERHRVLYLLYKSTGGYRCTQLVRLDRNLCPCEDFVHVNALTAR